ncbi:MAG: glycosyltransferase family 2 protein [Methanobrevibacter sp.]|uniref:glycosyltransferase family 2 protein n=1 Tax=Methanobrevibacter sp. TaxID=66852 RepID=UPI0025FA3537|nr:glycosyltransferase family 2 protein [Methanobrevibacter sp.]MBR0270964.1 glycosyltransferase family 2 protein [Methanobrevibacter sp.]
MSYKLSVVIPVYNVESYIGECLDSIVNQTLGIENIEVIIVNDKTPDNSMEIVKEYASDYPSFKIINHEENKGLGGSRNTGLKHVTSDYVTFVDSDDFISSDTFKDSLSKIEDSGADLLIYNMQTYTGNECIVDESVHNQNFAENIIVDDINDYPKLFFSTSACNKIYHKSLFPLIEFSKGLYEDNVTISNVLLNAKRIYLSKNSSYFYRKNPESITERVSKKNVFDLCDVISGLFDLKDYNVNLLAINFINDVLFWIYYYDWPIADEISFVNKLQSSINTVSEEDIERFIQLVPNKKVYKEDILSLLKYDSDTFLAKFKYFNSLNKVKSTASLYIDIGDGFNEINKVSIDYCPLERNKLTFDLSNFDNIQSLRFDPLEGDFIKARINNIDVIDTNSDNPDDEYQIFTNLDPNYILDCKFTDELIIDFDLIFLNKTDIANILNNKNNIINEFNQKNKKGRFNFLK